jgi:hypothetical protein
MTAVRLALLAGGLALVSPLFAADPPPARFPAASNADAWKQLPRATPPLPAWARILIHSLPKTTGAMLELDAVHRARNPLGPVLAAQLRWEAANAIGCDYAKAYAAADWARSGAKGKPALDPALRDFARQVATDAAAVTDEQFAELLQKYGAEKMVAVVHTLAHANFQNRIFLALGVAVEPGGPLPPFDVKLDPDARAKLVTPPRPAWDEIRAKTGLTPTFEPDWKEQSDTALAKAMAEQKSRTPRIQPDPKRVAALPPEARPQASRIVWTAISMGYQPLLTKTWFDTMSTFQSEAKFDRVFSNSYFWVITRANDCFY